MVKNAGKLLGKGILPLVILGAGIIVGGWFFVNPDEAKKRPRPEAQALLVETGRPEAGSFPAIVEAMGQVRAAVEIDLKSQVGGEIIVTEEEFIPGGFFKEGDTILDIDPSDYELAVKKQEAVLRQVQADYDLEMGRQSVAKDELKILERTTGRKPETPDLALRRPQLAQAQAEIEKAQSDLDDAKLDLSRTRVMAPFNALVTERDATLGDKVSAGETLATIVSTDEYWIEISVPVTDLQWLDIPKRAGDKGSAAKIILDGGRGERSGYLLKATGALDAQSRLATLLISVPDPLFLEQPENSAPPLILGDYAKVVMEGRALHDMTRLPLSWVRDGNVVWLKKDGKLIYQNVQVVYEDRDYAYVSEGLAEDDEIVISDIAVPVKEMKIRTAGEARAAVSQKDKGAE